jgi:hypothetical protein
MQILVGDHLQLQARSEFYDTHAALQASMQHHSRSAMDRLIESWERGQLAAGQGDRNKLTPPLVRLKTQYRMHAAICHLVDTTFYRPKVNKWLQPDQVRDRLSDTFGTGESVGVLGCMCCAVARWAHSMMYPDII